MKLPPYRTLTLAQAAEEFDLKAAWESNPWTEGDDELFDTFDEDTRVLVFDGDTKLDKSLDPYNTNDWSQDNFLKLIANHQIIVVKGSLEVGFVSTVNIKALFVFGDLRCEKAKFYKHNLVWVQGDLVAKTAVLGLSDQDDARLAEQDGAFTVRVQGKASSPVVRSWWMGLSHLNWTPESGKEFREEKELPDTGDHLNDPLWKNSL